MKSALLRRVPSVVRAAKRVRWVDEEGRALATVHGAPALVYQDFETVSRRRLRPLFNIPTTGSAAKKAKSAWGEAWPTAPVDDDDDDDDYEWVREWFCDECQETIPDGAIRYECAQCPKDYCRCAACYRSGVIGGDRPHAHPLVASSKAAHITEVNGLDGQ